MAVRQKLLAMVFSGVFAGVSAVVAAVLPIQAFAWGADAHRATGEIAWQLLEAPVQQKVLQLLRAKGETSLAEAGTWADRIRSDESYRWAAPLHYINLPEQWHGYDSARDCPEQGCILEAIRTYRDKLADTSLPEGERAEALLFLVHFVEDVHQPMHTGLRADRGGNDVNVSFYGFETNLHALWDTYLPAGFIGDWQQFATQQVDRIDRREVLNGMGDASASAGAYAEEWVKESHRLAHRNAYTDSAILGEHYYEKNRAVAELRLRQGGIRLAVLLTQILGDAEG